MPDLQKIYIQELIHTGAILIRTIHEEPFTLRSGRKSYIFVNHSKIASSPKGYRAYIDSIKNLLEDTYKKNAFILCNVDSKISAQMVGSLAYILRKPQIIFKSRQLTAIEKGPGEQLTGDLNWNLPVAIIDDVATGGDGTAANVAKLIQQTFPKIKDIQIFVGLVRNANTLQSTFPLHAVLTYDALLKHAWDKLSPQQQEAIKKERSLNPQ